MPNTPSSLNSLFQMQNPVPEESSYVPPEKGGDGTNGEDTEEILSELRLCRRIVDLRRLPSGQDRRFEFGDLVYDRRTEEHGVVLGEKPELHRLEDQVSHLVSGRKLQTTATYIVLTISTKDETRMTRIRYVNEANLRRIEEPDRNTLTDLDNFCQNQCIQACSDVCSLYKYKRFKDLPDE